MLDVIILFLGSGLILTSYAYFMGKRNELMAAFVCLILVSLLFLFRSYRVISPSVEARQALREVASYDALQSCETADFQMTVLDGKWWEKDVCYYSKKYNSYRYYRVKPDFSYEEISPIQYNQCKGE